METMHKALIIGIVISIVLFILLTALSIYVYLQYRLTLKNPNDILQRLQLYENYTSSTGIPYTFKILNQDNKTMQVAYYEAQGFRKGINVFTTDYQQPHINQLTLNNFNLVNSGSEVLPKSPWILTYQNNNITLTLPDKNIILNSV